MSRAVLLVGFAVLVAAMVVLEILARLGRGGRATLGDVVEITVRHPAGRAVALLSWLWVGWHLFAR